MNVEHLALCDRFRSPFYRQFPNSLPVAGWAPTDLAVTQTRRIIHSCMRTTLHSDIVGMNDASKYHGRCLK
jgi:hypothetical protein